MSSTQDTTEARGGWPTEETDAEFEAKQSQPFGDVETDEHGMPTDEALNTAMKAVVDPEIGINVVDLGLVYGYDKTPDEGKVTVVMTLTSMGCPLTELIHQQVSLILARMPGVKEVDVEFTFSPPWSTDMISDEAREELRAMGFSV
ncbi:MAG TPA: metal-sulfur cluster assembly factor [Egibacteraceae bacterium]|nr:metal-sulfur cluster assembly factor [Egibacteraceae bacterium]